MPALSTTTVSVIKPAAGPDGRKWWIVDATDQPLGRLSSRIAGVLRGKHTPAYTKHNDNGDYVVVINAEKVRLTGNKLDGKTYNKHSAIPGGFRAEPYRSVLARKPELALEKAVKGMLPKTPLGKAMHAKLKVYAGSSHPHAAQKPAAFTF